MKKLLDPQSRGVWGRGRVEFGRQRERKPMITGGFGTLEIWGVGPE
jgi:hypothetical protein